MYFYIDRKGRDSTCGVYNSFTARQSLVRDLYSPRVLQGHLAAMCIMYTDILYKPIIGETMPV
jgi:hypothetical protein